MKSHNSGLTYVITVQTTPTLIKGHDVEPRIALSMYNENAAIVYWGFDSSITTTTGFPLEATTGKVSMTGFHGTVYAIVASGTADIRVMTY